jgi:peptide/nickel transport system permease protein
LHVIEGGFFVQNGEWQGIMDSIESQSPTKTFSRVIKYVTVRAVTLTLIVFAGIFLAILVINYGGYIDNIYRANINESLNFVSLSMPGATIEQVAEATAQIRWSMEEAYGLHKPFLLRCIRWWYETITFNWGETYQFGITGFGSGVMPVSKVVLQRMPYTLLLAGVTNLLLFFASMYAALSLSKKNGSLIDRLAVSMSPLSAIPNWVYGIILTVVFAGELHLLPFSGLYDTFPPANKLGYIPIVAKHMILPVTAIFLGMFFSALYTWRTFFLIHSGEDYMELAYAKGVPARTLNSRYVLKPTLPYIITSFLILLITFWQGIIVLEVFFDWPGLGQLFMNSIRGNNIRVSIGIVTVFAMLLGISIFLLDIIYALVDPRVKIGTESQTTEPIRAHTQGIFATFSLAFLRFRRDVWKQISSIGKPRPVVPRPRRLAASRSADEPRKISAPPFPVQASRPTQFAFGSICPHLKLDNSRGLALYAPASRCRCYVNGRAERVGATFQAQVCRSQKHAECPRLVMSFPHIKSVNKKGLLNQSRLRPLKTGSLYLSLRELIRYPLAICGILVIIALIGISIYTIITIPYSKAVELWLPQTAEKLSVPKNAQPIWVNWFRKEPLPPTIIQNSADGQATKVINNEGNGIIDETITYTIDYPYNDFPKDLVITFNGQYEKKPFVILTWTTPDGREFKLGNFSVVSTQRFLVTRDLPKKYLISEGFTQKGILESESGGPIAVQAIFKNPDITETPTPLPGQYTLRIDTTLFEEKSNLDAEMIVYGQVYGLAGTDDLRRDLMVPLLWGIPIALAFGFLGAITTGVLAMLIAAVGVWYGGWLDSIIQRLTEINMILPTLPIAITIYFLYSKSIWVVLGVIIVLSIFGSAIKTYRAAFLQVKGTGYIEAAQAYGASNWHIIRHYLVPRIIPLLIPQLVILVPSYVFFEATLAYLNISDPKLPTWGKVIYDALTRGTYQGYYYWVLEPVAMIIITGLAFAVVGFALDSILNPKLRRM